MHAFLCLLSHDIPAGAFSCTWYSSFLMPLTNPLKRSFVWERQLTFGPFDAVPASKREQLHGIHRTIFHSCSSLEVSIKKCTNKKQFFKLIACKCARHL
jgi:hypothetical protein